MKNLKSSLAIVIAATAALTACGSTGGGSGGAQDNTVTIGYENNGSVDPAQASLSLRLYQKYIKGKVKLVYFDSGPAALTALGSGDVDIMTGIGNPPVSSAIANKVPVTVIWAEELGQTDQALVVKKGSGISSIAGLAGHEVGTVVGSTASYALSAVLKKNGVPEGKVTMRNMSPQTLLTAWTKGQISAAYIWLPVLGKLLDAGGVKLADNSDVQDIAPIYNFSIVNKDWAATHSQTVKEFIKAQDEGVKAMRQQPDATIKAMLVNTGETLAEAQMAAKAAKAFDAAEQLGKNALGPDNANSLVATSLVAASEYLHSIDPSHVVLKPTDVQIDRSFVKAYLKEQGGS